MAEYKEVGRLMVPTREQIISKPTDNEIQISDKKRLEFIEEWEKPKKWHRQQ